MKSPAKPMKVENDLASWKAAKSASGLHAKNEGFRAHLICPIQASIYLILLTQLKDQDLSQPVFYSMIDSSSTYGTFSINQANHPVF